MEARHTQTPSLFPLHHAQFPSRAPLEASSSTESTTSTRNHSVNPRLARLTRLRSGIFDIRFKKEAIHLRMNILDCDLESVECTRLSDLYLCHEPTGEVFKDDSVGGGEEGEDVFDEVAFTVGERIPVAEILREINFFGGPKRSFGFFVHFPDLRELDWEHAETIRVWSKKRFF
ncbi:hypothetical protein Lal_00048484 [Lupinus albus]|nr:hypothetical protein Lal_00048484 [Lupinus albus]